MVASINNRPEVRSSHECTLVGSPLDVPPRTSVCSGTHEALLVSEEHFRLPSGAWSGGGPFYCWKRRIAHTGKLDVPVVRNNLDLGTFTILGNASVPAGVAWPPEPPAWPIERDILDGYYASGYNRAKPGNAVASLGQFIVELRDLPSLPFRKHFVKKSRSIATTRYPLSEVPRVLHERLKEYRDLGSEYLNYAFGWKPFVSDLRKMYNLWQDVDKRLARIIRENGEGVHRKATVKDEKSVTSAQTEFPFAYANLRGAPPNYFGSWNWSTGVSSGSKGRSKQTVTSRSMEKVWFSGTFRYYIPDLSTSQWDRRARRALFGANPSPELLWEVLPWSWLIDYFSNVGDVMSNASSGVDNLTVKRSFIMRHTLTEVTYTVWSAHDARNTTGTFATSWPSVDNTWTSTDVVETKARDGGGNPFGLHVELSSLSAFQLSILAALGISRGLVQ